MKKDIIENAARFHARTIAPLARFIAGFWANAPYRKTSKLKGRKYPKTRACPWCFRAFTEVGIKLHQRKCERRPKTGTATIDPIGSSPRGAAPAIGDVLEINLEAIGLEKKTRVRVTRICGLIGNQIGIEFEVVP